MTIASDPAFVPWAQWNVALFEHMRGSDMSPPWLIATAIVLAKWVLVAGLLITIWQLWKKRSMAGALRLVGAWLVSHCLEVLANAFAFHPRPFVAGYGPALMAHSADNSMPSSHVTLGLILVAVLLTLQCLRSAIVVLGLTVVLAWSRIYIGIHWPIDMVGALVSASVAVGLALLVERLCIAVKHQWIARHHPGPAVADPPSNTSSDVHRA